MCAREPCSPVAECESKLTYYVKANWKPSEVCM